MVAFINDENGVVDQSNSTAPKSILKLIDNLNVKNKKKRLSATFEIYSYLLKKQQVRQFVHTIKVSDYR